MAQTPTSPWLKTWTTWFDDARKAGIHNAEAMTLATTTARGIPAARIVLFKGMVRGGFAFYTNYGSRKAQELDSHPRAALVFHWDPLERQIRIEGRVTRCTPAESDKYFATRERGSQIGAWASHQSSEITGRRQLERQVAEVEKRFAGQIVPRPEFWGGYRVVPTRIEFWQGGEHRLHDRTVYALKAGKWKKTLLSP